MKPKFQNIKFVDTISLNPIQVDEENINLFITRTEESEKSLIVKAQATHSCRVTGNSLLYLPYLLRDAVKTMTIPYQKPVLVFHKEDSVAIGRVEEATYIPVKSPLVSDAIFLFLDSVKNAKDAIPTLNRIYDVINDYMFEGLGYIDVTARITDEKAISDITSGRFLTMSIGFSLPGDVLTSGNGKSAFDLDNEEFPGLIVDDKKIFGVPEKMVINEVSYVNTPADAFALTYNFEFSDSVKKIEYAPKYGFTTDVGLYLDTLKNNDHIIKHINKFGHYKYSDQVIHGGLMKAKISQLTDTKAVYDAMKKHLAPEDVVSDEKLTSLDNSNSVGIDSVKFPIFNQKHKDAAIKVLENYKDGTKIFKALSDAIMAFEIVDSPTNKDSESNSSIETLLFQADNSLSNFLNALDDEKFKMLFDAIYEMGRIKGLITTDMADSSLKSKIDELETKLNESSQVESVYKAQIDNLTKVHENTKKALEQVLTDLKDLYVNKIIEQREALGESILEADKTELVGELKGRTIDSLKDSVKDNARLIDKLNKKTDNNVPPPPDPNKPNGANKDDQDKEYEVKLKAIYKQYEAIKPKVSRSEAGDWLKTQITELDKSFEKNNKK